MMFVHAKKPQNLTKLCIMPAFPQPTHSPLLLDKPDAAPFPSSITALDLPEHQLNPFQAWIFPGMTLTSLALKSISNPESIEHLPSTLTDLRLENFRVTDALLEASPEGHRASRALWAWPPKMENLTVGLWPDDLPLVCPPMVTKFKVLAPFSPRKNPLRYCDLPPSLNFLEMPFACLREDALDSIPRSIVRLTVLDICLRGISIPKDIQAIETMTTLRTYFDKVPRPFQLVILRPYNSTKKEQLVNFHLEQFNSLQTLTLNNYNHSTDLRIQPRTLTHLAFIPLTDNMVLNLPPTLTKLVFHQIEQDDPIVVSNLLWRCPKLTRVKTALPEHLNSITTGAIKATLALTWHYLPKDCYDLCSDIKPHFKSPISEPIASSSTVDAATTLAIASNMPPLTLPEDVWNTFKQIHTGVKFRGFNYDYFQVLCGVRTLMTSRTTIKGVFQVRKEFLDTGFQPGLEFADLSKAGFTRSETRGRLDDLGFPLLPETVTELLVGPYMLRARHRAVNGVSISPIPKSVRTLELDYGTAFIIRKDLKKMVPKSVTRLELWFEGHGLTDSVRSEIEKHFTILGSGGKFNSKATSPTHLTAVRPEGKDTNNCSIM